MSDPADKDKQPVNELAGLPALFKEWQGLIAALGGAVAAALAVLLPGQTPAFIQVIGYTVAVVLLGVGCFIFIKVRRRRHSKRLRERRRETWEREMAEAHRTAFRGLFPYQEGDELPGEHRQLEARRLITQFTEPTFSFGVVCGDSGCGKTSLLRSAIQSRLKAVGEERGFNVLYLSSPRELAEDGAPHGERANIARRLGREMDRLRQLADGASQGRPLILIVDQFEEFFIEYNRPELRLEIGCFLNGLIKASPPVRILCALRRDYLADMKDLAPQSPDAADRGFFEPLSLQSLFTLKNFTVEQAARVIRECAERDRIDLDDDFAMTLASDLGEGDFVRPPELQIVCTALVGNMTTAEYRLAGGARGILSHYIEDAIEVSGDPNTGRRVLRALCDFPAHAKRNPQTVADIAEAVGAGDPQGLASIRAALRQFEVARLVVSERRGVAAPTYALVHAYLVDAVSKATSDVSTRDEEANQMLEYYVSEYRVDHKTIPYPRLRFVRKYADRKKLADPTVRRLLRASLTRLVTFYATLTALVVGATTLLVALTTTSHAWHQNIIGSHREGNNSGGITWVVEPKRKLLLARILDGSGRYNSVKLWDVRTASPVHSFKYAHLKYSLPDYILGYSENEPVVTAFHIPTGRESQTAIPTEFASGIRDSPVGDVIISSSGTTIALRESGVFSRELAESRRQPPPTVRVFSVADNKPIGETSTCYTYYGDFKVTNDGEHFIALCYEKEVREPTAFDVLKGEKRTLVRAGYKQVGVFAFDDRSSRVASLELYGDGRVCLVLWDIRTGQAIDQSDVNLRVGSGDKLDGSVSFTPDGEFLYVTTTLSAPGNNTRLTLYRTNGLRRVTIVPEDGVRVIHAADNADDTGRNDHVMLAWPDASGGTYLWDLTESEPRLIEDFTLSEDPGTLPRVSLSDTGVRAINILRETGQVELWDFKAGKKLRDLDITGRFNEVKFTIGGNAVSVNVEDGTVSLFSADSGEKITDDIRNIGGNDWVIFYDEKCRRIHVWTDKGRVLRYTYGWHLFGREKWFWPAEKCEAN